MTQFTWVIKNHLHSCNSLGLFWTQLMTPPLGFHNYVLSVLIKGLKGKSFRFSLLYQR